MKKLLTTTISVLLLLLITLGAAGTASDPLVTRRWLEREYRETLMRDVETAITAAYDSELRRLTSQIDSGTPLVAPEGFVAAPADGAVTLTQGQTLRVAQGATFHTSATDLTATVGGGVILDLTDGIVMPTSFTPAANHRYFVAEGAQLALTPHSRVTVYVDGYIKTAGEALTHHPVFKDVPVEAWFYDAVDYAYSNALFSGTSVTEFSPNLAMTRGMFVTVLGRLAGVDVNAWTAASESPQFTDVADGAYYAPYVRWASTNGIVLGYADGSFLPDTSVTREQMAALMYRYELWLGGNGATDAAAAGAFPDYGAVSDWAREPMQWAVASRIINGSDGKLMPQSTATRAQVAQIVKNYKSR